MPHITLEYSNNIVGEVDFAQLLDALHQALAEIETFDGDRIKSRAIGYLTYRIGAGNKDDAFVHAQVVFSQGRPEEVRTGIGKRLLAIVENGVIASRTQFAVAKSVEIRQFEKSMYFRD